MLCATARCESDAELIGVPLQAQFARRRHVAENRRRGDDRGACKIAFAAKAHTVLPVSIERRDGALARVQRVGALAETRAAPRLTDLSANRAEHGGDRLAVEPRIGALDLTGHAARARKDHEFLRRLRRALLSRGSD